MDVIEIREERMEVVQGLRYPKAGRTEVGVHLGVMPFDAYLVTPTLQLSVTGHLRERVGMTLFVSGGYGLPTSTYQLLTSPTYGVTPDVYRYLGSFHAGGDFAFAYGKLNVDGARVVHFDLYAAKRIGATIEAPVDGTGGLALGPNFSPALGGRIWLSRSLALRLEVRDDLLVAWRLEDRMLTFTQNANLSIGLVTLTRGNAPPDRP